MGINVLDPRRGTLLGLAERCRISRVVTIDTALVHLCAAAGQRADLLLSTFPDERWQELHRPDHHYGQLIRISLLSIRLMVSRAGIADRFCYAAG